MLVKRDIETGDDNVDTDHHEYSDSETASSTVMSDVSMIPVKVHQPNLPRTFRNKSVHFLLYGVVHILGYIIVKRMIVFFAFTAT